jgi:hypothetical protein
MKRVKHSGRGPAKPLDVVSPATGSEIRRALGITKATQRNVMRAFRAAGVKVEPQSPRHAPKSSKRSAGIKVRHARCKRVLVILNSRIETVDLLREVIHSPPPHPDYDEEPVELAVVRFVGLDVYVPCGCVVFLHDEKRIKSKAQAAT